jgi:hypothetical protein
MHLSIDSARPAADAATALVAACRAHGLRIARSTALPRGPRGRSVIVVEIADPLPDVPHDALAPGPAGSDPAASASHDVYRITVFETGPDRCRLSTLHPTALIDLLGHPECAPAALAFERTLHEVMAQAAGVPLPPAPPHSHR